ncbi:hypothetical protein [Corynebacterium phoceense]|uniref:hypothetical protein n=1 Tax=Corynebacterium phoceense TaxID=1686286 RepID=UPI0018AB0329|nr:hypothetical protein [Corynebacterium phoceense]MBF9011270.1 hypothetical protein [Corynebacterium phoceense]
MRKFIAVATKVQEATTHFTIFHTAETSKADDGMRGQREPGYYIVNGNIESAPKYCPKRFETIEDAITRAELEEERIAKRAADRKAAKVEKAATATKVTAETTTAPTAGNLATPRQVEYIMTLIARGAHEEGGFYSGPTTREKVAMMDRKSASLYIDSLKGNY